MEFSAWRASLTFIFPAVFTMLCCAAAAGKTFSLRMRIAIALAFGQCLYHHPQMVIGFTHRGLSPHKFTPATGVHKSLLPTASDAGVPPAAAEFKH